MKLTEVLSNIFLGPLADAYKSRQERKVQEKQLDTKLQEKKLEGMEKADSAEHALSIAQINSAGWKDEWFVLLFSVPLVMAFAGDTGRVMVQEGFAALDAMPTYYKVFLSSAVAASFGLHTVERAWKWWVS